MEILDDIDEARARVEALVTPGASVLTGASETLRLSGIEADLNSGDRHDAVRPRVLAMDRACEMDEIRRLSSAPDFIVASARRSPRPGRC